MGSEAMHVDGHAMQITREAAQAAGATGMDEDEDDSDDEEEVSATQLPFAPRMGGSLP